MENENKLHEIEEIMDQSGYTLADLMNHFGIRNSSLLNMRDDDIAICNRLYESIEDGRLSSREKGQKLEEFAAILFEKSVDNLLDVYKNCRTSTNEIDLLVRWSEIARLAGLQSSFSFMGEMFLCECKNYNGPVNVTYVGKFSSLMSVTNTDFGVMISWEGVTGRGKWADSKGLIKKIALREKKYIVILEKEDLRKICKKEKNIFSALYDKYTALKNEIDYDKYIKKHDAEDMMRREG